MKNTLIDFTYAEHKVNVAGRTQEGNKGYIKMLGAPVPKKKILGYKCILIKINDVNVFSVWNERAIPFIIKNNITEQKHKNTFVN